MGGEIMHGKNHTYQFKDILEQHKAILVKVARGYCPRPSDREDLMQEMMIQIWQALPRYDPQYKMSTWLYRIALNVAISWYRKSVVRGINQPLDEQLLEDMADAGPPGEGASLQLLEIFINELKDLDKALMLLYLDDKSHAEIAEILGLSISNVGTKVSRIRAQLKQRFKSIEL